MSGIDNKCQEKRIKRTKRWQQKLDCDKFHGSGKDEKAHQHRIDKRKTFAPHQKSIRHPQKQKSDTNRQSMGKCCPESFCFHIRNLSSLVFTLRNNRWITLIFLSYHKSKDVKIGMHSKEGKSSDEVFTQNKCSFWKIQVYVL